MKTETLTSVQNPLVKKWKQLNKSRSARMAERQFIAEGEHMTQEAVQEGFAEALIVSSEQTDRYAGLLSAPLPVWQVAPHVMEAICDTKAPQGILALCRMPDLSGGQPGRRTVALDGVQDPGNVGTILRTMDAAGFDTLLIDPRTADPYSPKTLRASMGSIFRIPVILADDLPAVLTGLQASHAILAGDLNGTPFYERRHNENGVCIIIGNEGAGISPEVFAASTERLRLPMVGRAESLNAAVAAAVMMYDVLRCGG